MTGRAPSGATRAGAIALALLALAAAGLRVAHLRELSRNDILARSPQGDEATYAAIARRVARGQDDAVPYQAPLYPTLLGGLERVVGEDCFGTARALQAALGLVTAALAAALARRLTGSRRAAVIAFGLAALARPLLHAEGTLLREPASAALLAALALAYAKVQERASESFEEHAALGLALGLGLVLRENFAVVAVAVLAERALALARAARLRGRTAAAAALALALGTALPLVPFDAKNARLGEGVHVLPHWNSGCVFYLANRRDNSSVSGYEPPPFVARGNPEAEEEGFRAEAERRTGVTLAPHQVSAFWLREGLREIAADPGRFATRVLQRAATTLVPWETAHQRDPDVDARTSWVLRAPLPGTGVLLVLGALGALVALADRRAPGERALALVLGAWWLSLVVAAFTSRYRVPALPLLAVLGARGLVGLERLARTGARRRLAAVLAGTLAVAALVLFVLPARRAPADHTSALRMRGLAALAARDARLAAAMFDEASRDHDDRDPELLVLLGRAWLGARQPLRAWAAFELARRAAPEADEAERGIAFAELGLARPHEAARRLEAVLARAPQDQAVASALAGARNAAGRVADAPLPPGARDDPRALLR